MASFRKCSRKKQRKHSGAPEETRYLYIANIGSKHKCATVDDLKCIFSVYGELSPENVAGPEGSVETNSCFLREFHSYVIFRGIYYILVQSSYSN